MREHFLEICFNSYCQYGHFKTYLEYLRELLKNWKQKKKKNAEKEWNLVKVWIPTRKRLELIRKHFNCSEHSF